MHVCSTPIKKQTSIHAHKIIIFKSFLISQVVAADYVYFSARCLCANPVGLQGTRHLGLANFQSSLLPLRKCHDQHTWPLGRCFYTNQCQLLGPWDSTTTNSVSCPVRSATPGEQAHVGGFCLYHSCPGLSWSHASRPYTGRHKPSGAESSHREGPENLRSLSSLGLALPNSEVQQNLPSKHPSFFKLT